jgi:hypothetical protein
MDTLGILFFAERVVRLTILALAVAWRTTVIDSAELERMADISADEDVPVNAEVSPNEYSLAPDYRMRDSVVFVRLCLPERDEDVPGAHVADRS